MAAQFQRGLQFAFQHQRAFVHIGSIHDFAAHGGQAGGGEFVLLGTGDHARKVDHGCLGRRGHADRERLARHDGLVRPAFGPHGHGDAGRVGAADAAPGGGHDVGFAFFIIGGHQKGRHGVGQSDGTKSFFHIVTSLSCMMCSAQPLVKDGCIASPAACSNMWGVTCLLQRCHCLFLSTYIAGRGRASRPPEGAGRGAGAAAGARPPAGCPGPRRGRPPGPGKRDRSPADGPPARRRKRCTRRRCPAGS